VIPSENAFRNACLKYTPNVRDTKGQLDCDRRKYCKKAIFFIFFHKGNLLILNVLRRQKQKKAAAIRRLQQP
jgi:hypothetical protein